MNGLLDDLLEIGKLVAPMVIPGAGPAIAIAERVIAGIDRVRAGGNNDPRLAETRDVLEARIHAKAGEVSDSLRKGGDPA